MGCLKQTDHKPNGSSPSQQDSVLAWLDLSKDPRLPLDQKRNLLKKARVAANGMRNDSLKTKYFSKISLAYYKMDDSLNFREANRQTMLFSQISNDSIVLAEAHWDLGSFFRGYAVEDSAYYHYSTAQKIYNSLGNNYLTGRMFYNMAVVQGDVKDYTGAEINAIKAIEYIKPLNEYKQLYNCYNLMGVIYNSLNEFDKSLEYYQDALKYLEFFKNTEEMRLGTLNNIGSLYLNKEEYSMASSYFERVVSIDSLKRVDPMVYSKALSNYARTRLSLEDTIGLHQKFSEALVLQDSINDISGMALSHYFLAEYALVQKDTTKALSHAMTSKSLAEKSTNNKRLLESLELISRVDKINSQRNLQEYIHLNDSLQREERQIRNKFARIQFETDQFILQNQLLARQKQLWLGIAIGVFFLALAILGIISLRIKNQRLRFQQQQQESNLEIFNLMLSQKEKFLEGKHEEQKRVSEELHDGILGQMLGIRLVLTGLNGKTNTEAVYQRAEYIKKLQDVEEELRTISHELNHAAYQKIHNFIYSLEDLLKTLGKTSAAVFNFDYTMDLEWDRLKGELKINMYRIIQESLQNCLKHAEADNITLKLGADEKNIKIHVTDDGKGFDGKKGRKGIGLKNIRSRVNKMRGTWDIKSKVGHGTEVYIEIPYLNSLEPTTTKKKKAVPEETL
jgi:signal transduction histidine kinase